jgi:hypothetical protein
MNAWVDLAGKKRAMAKLPVARNPMLGESGFKRVEGDRYWTESWVTQALIDGVKLRGLIWEPACGRGDMADVLIAAGYEVMVSDIAGDALGCKNAAKADFLAHGSPGDALFSIVTNPPYVLAEEFIRHAIDLTARASGMVAMLLRNEYDCAASRRYLFEREAFAAKLVLTRRPRWADGLGQSSASPRHNFAWYLWDHHNSAPARIKWLPQQEFPLLDGVRDSSI